jgi:hemerythrin-like domain-containing protein
MHEPADITPLVLTHRAMRHSTHRLHAAVASLEPEDRRRARAIARWFDGFTGELHHHHGVEDDIAFPALAARVPAFEHHAEELADDHEHLDRLIGALTGGLRGLAGHEPWTALHEEAVALTAELRDHLDQHLDHEDADIVPLLARHFTAEEFAQQHDEAVKRLSPRQMLFTVPWLGWCITPDEREALFASSPRLLRIVWRLRHRAYGRATTYALGPIVEVVR